jgi:hypothetical protein
MLRHAIIGFAAAALVSTALMPDEALARGGAGHGGGHGGIFHGGIFHGGARFGVGNRPMAARPVGAAVGALGHGEVRALVIGEAVGAARIGGYYGNSHSSTALAAHPATNARDVDSFERRGPAAVGAAVGTPAASVYYGGTSDYPNYCNRDSHGGLACPYPSSAAGHRAP